MTGKSYYVHQNDPFLSKANQERFTLAIEIPEKDYLVDCVMDSIEHPGVPMDLFLGIAKVHPKDNYNKKIGRAIALEKSKLTDLYLLGLSTNDGKTSYLFRSYFRVNEGDSLVRSVVIQFSTVLHSEHVKVEYAQVM